MRQFILGIVALSLSSFALASSKPQKIQVEFKTSIWLPAYNLTNPLEISGKNGASCWIYNDLKFPRRILAGTKVTLDALYWDSEATWWKTDDIGISCNGGSIISISNASYSDLEFHPTTFKAMQTEMDGKLGFKIIQPWSFTEISK